MTDKPLKKPELQKDDEVIATVPDQNVEFSSRVVEPGSEPPSPWADHTLDDGRKIRVHMVKVSSENGGARFSYSWWWAATYDGKREADGVGAGFPSAALALDDALAYARRG